MKMKCIGGLADGRVEDVEEYLKRHDMVRIIGRITFKLDDFEKSLRAFREGKVPESQQIPYYLYRICEIHWMDKGQKQTISYLIPEKWSEWEAIVHLFRCHNAT